MNKTKNKVKTTTSRTEKVVIGLVSGKRRSQSAFEDKLSKQVADIKKKGGVIVIPYD